MGRLPDKIAIVTGASSGIGRAIALRFAAEGARVIAVARRLEKLQGVAAESQGEVTPYACDISQPEAVEALGEFCRQRYGRLDVLANNAGIGGESNKRLHELSMESFDRVMNVNVRGALLVLRQAVALMLESGGGAIVNMASIGSFRATAGSGAYITSKGALLMMTRTAALEYVKDNIRVNAVCPGVIRTGILDNAPEELISMLQARVPQGRMGTPEEVAAVALFLASDEASHVTGASYFVDGGRGAG
jgi:NAD(P)-dependent dehydrogenase (short-subunit alcohol dehydrogenase family)